MGMAVVEAIATAMIAVSSDLAGVLSNEMLNDRVPTVELGFIPLLRIELYQCVALDLQATGTLRPTDSGLLCAC